MSRPDSDTEAHAADSFRLLKMGHGAGRKREKAWQRVRCFRGSPAGISLSQAAESVTAAGHWVRRASSPRRVAFIPLWEEASRSARTLCRDMSDTYARGLLTSTPAARRPPTKGKDVESGSRDGSTQMV
ncbi:hypothetical protein MRX96_014388 [Rhipicephalus microplus]